MNRPRRRAVARLGAATAMLAGMNVRGSAASAVIAPFSSLRAGDGMPAGWSPLRLGAIAPTRYAVVENEGRVVVRAEANASASGLAFRFAKPVERLRALRWTWRAERLPSEADTSTRPGDDAVARMYVTFREPRDRVGAVQRASDEVARLLYGEAPPHATLLYVWDNRARMGTTFANPYTDRVHNLVVETGSSRLGQWLAYERDVASDFRNAFGRWPPPATGVALMTDADNTGSSAIAYYGDVSADGS